MMHDYYEDFTDRFEIASAIRENRLPLTAMDEIRNSFDHFAKALVAAAIADGELAPGALPAEQGPPSTDPRHMLDAMRGLRHIVSGQYFCDHFAATWTAEEIIEILKTTLATTSPRLGEFQQRLEEAGDKLGAIGAPSDARYYSLATLNTAIADLRRLVEALHPVADEIEELYRDIRLSGIDGVLL